MELCQRFFGFQVQYCGDFHKNEAVFIGSILQNFIHNTPTQIPSAIPLCVWGSGIIYPPKPQEYLTREMDIYALRGKETKQRLESLLGKSLQGIALGDPGLLANTLVLKSK